MSLTRMERKPHKRIEDPVLSMLGVGRQLWERETGDRFVERLRSEDIDNLPVSASVRMEDLYGTVWHRVQECQGELFHTARGLPFTFQVEGNGMWFFRNRKRINRKLPKVQFEVAVSRCPLKSTTEIKDLMDYAYLYALLMDRRIRAQAW